MEEAGIEVTTLEPNPGTAVFGSSKHHLMAAIGALGQYVPPDNYDVIIINGVIGMALV